MIGNEPQVLRCSAASYPFSSRPETLDMERLGKVGNFWGSQNNPLSSAQRLDPYDSYPQSDVAAFAAQTRLNPYVDLHASSLSQKLFKFLINITFSFFPDIHLPCLFSGITQRSDPFPPCVRSRRLSGEPGALLETHFTAIQVALVADEHDDHIPQRLTSLGKNMVWSKSDIEKMGGKQALMRWKSSEQ